MFGREDKRNNADEAEMRAAQVSSVDTGNVNNSTESATMAQRIDTVSAAQPDSGNVPAPTANIAPRSPSEPDTSKESAVDNAPEVKSTDDNDPPPTTLFGSPEYHEMIAKMNPPKATPESNTNTAPGINEANNSSSPEQEKKSGGLSGSAEIPYKGEDRHDVTPDGSLGLLCDGMGGHANGGRASGMAQEKIISELNKHAIWSDPNLTPGKIANTLMNTLIKVSKEMAVAPELDPDPNDKESRRGGSTAAIYKVFKQGDQKHLIAANVGDSPIYVFHKDTQTLEKVSQEDNILAHKVKDLSAPERADYQNALDNVTDMNWSEYDDKFKQKYGKSRLEELFNQRNVITQYLGQEDIIPRISITEIADHDFVFEVSDGVNDNLTHEEIAEVAKQAEDPQELCKNLTNKAFARSTREDNKRSKRDDITAVASVVTSNESKEDNTNNTNPPQTQTGGGSGRNTPPPANPPSGNGGGNGTPPPGGIHGVPLNGGNGNGGINPPGGGGGITPPGGIIGRPLDGGGNGNGGVTPPGGGDNEPPIAPYDDGRKPDLNKAETALRDFIRDDERHISFIERREEKRLQEKYGNKWFGKMRRFLAGEGESKFSKDFGRPINAALKVILGGGAIAGSIASGGVLAPLFLSLGGTAAGQGIIQGIKEGLRRGAKGIGEGKLREELSQVESRQKDIVTGYAQTALGLLRNNRININSLDERVRDDIKQALGNEVDQEGNINYSGVNYNKLLDLVASAAGRALSDADRRGFTPMEIEKGYRLINGEKELVPESIQDVRGKIDRNEKTWKIFEKLTGLVGGSAAVGAFLTGHIAANFDGDAAKNAVRVGANGWQYFRDGVWHPMKAFADYNGVIHNAQGIYEASAALASGVGISLIEAFTGFNRLKSEQKSKQASLEVNNDAEYNALFNNIRSTETPPPTTPSSPSLAPNPPGSTPPNPVTPPITQPGGQEPERQPATENKPADEPKTRERILSDLKDTFLLERNKFIQFNWDQVPANMPWAIKSREIKFTGLSNDASKMIFSYEDAGRIIYKQLHVDEFVGLNDDVFDVFDKIPTQPAPQPNPTAPAAPKTTPETQTSPEAKEIRKAERFRTGDKVQWINGGAKQFTELKSIEKIQKDRNTGKVFATVEGSPTGIPIEELSRTL